MEVVAAWRIAVLGAALSAAVGCGRSGPVASPAGSGDDDDDGSVPSVVTPSPTPRAAVPGDLVVNEVYFHIAVCVTAACDANRNGDVNAVLDEFVELVNIADVPVLLEGIELWDSDQISMRFEFGAGVLLDSAKAAVVFGSLQGTSAGSPAFGGSLVFESTTGNLSLNNSGDTLTVKDGSVVFGSVTWDGSTTPNSSWVLAPEITGGANYVTHTAELDEGGVVERNSSPGWRTDFTPF